MIIELDTEEDRIKCEEQMKIHIKSMANVKH